MQFFASDTDRAAAAEQRREGVTIGSGDALLTRRLPIRSKTTKRFQVVMRILLGSVDSPSAEPTITDMSKANKARFTRSRF